MNEPQLSAEMEKRFDEALGVGTYGKIVSFDDIKHFLATALESQTAEYVRKIKTMRVVAHGLGFLLDKDEVLDVLTQKKEDR